MDRARADPSQADSRPLNDAALAGILTAATLAVWVWPLWRWLRLAITLVHELGHAFVGILVGRKFTGFTIRGDMSGQAVTVGKATGLGRVVTTWAGYPMPGIIGTLMVVAAARGWAAPTLAVLLILLLVAAIRIRSGGTALVMLIALAAVGAAWWWRNNDVQQYAVAAVGLILLVGAWRHLWAVVSAGRGNRSSDPGVLAQLTGIPAVVWNLSFALTLAVCSWAAAHALLA